MSLINFNYMNHSLKNLWRGKFFKWYIFFVFIKRGHKWDKSLIFHFLSLCVTYELYYYKEKEAFFRNMLWDVPSNVSSYHILGCTIWWLPSPIPKLVELILALHTLSSSIARWYFVTKMILKYLNKFDESG